ncbi:MAG: class A beta-lactamase-related serine hydrolase [Candidatus Obscuribacterales bacterium]|nr:class A beta-lactamase-related serine hydrolase [Candidatus Obscuribacterales bacterium]
MRRVPPGQRLIRYLLLSAFISVMVGNFFPVGPDEPVKPIADASSAVTVPPFEKKEELLDLVGRLKQVADQPKLRAGAFVIEPSTGRYAGIDADESFAAASLIKVPVLVKLLDAIDRGQVSLDEQLELRPDLIGGGSGYLQWRPVNSKVSLREAMESMIVVSDNTATNLIIDRVGGIEACNRDFAFWGLKRTYVNDWLPDLPGTNKTSPGDLVSLLAMVDKGHLLTPESRSRMLKIMERTRIKTLLPPGLPAGAKISHKTGDIGSLVGDCGIVTTPEGKKFIAAVQVQRPHNDRRANEMIRQMSRVIYPAIVTGVPGPITETPAPASRGGHRQGRRRHR